MAQNGVLRRRISGMILNLDLVDDHHIVREGISTLLSSQPGYEVIHKAANGKEYLEQLKDQQIPDIAIIDLQMPVMNGYETMAALKEAYPSIKVLALTVDPSEDAMVRALKAGARGFIRKNAPPSLLRKALESIALTGYFFNDETQQLYTSNPTLKTQFEKQRDEILSRITEREKEFLRLICDDRELTYDQVAAEMGITRRTVDYYRTELFEKFNIKSKTGLVLFAIKNKLVG